MHALVGIGTLKKNVSSNSFSKIQEDSWFFYNIKKAQNWSFVIQGLKVGVLK